MPESNIASFFLPYCLRRQPDGRWLLLNRHYKPVGFFTKRYIDYDDPPVPPVPAAVRFKRPLAQATIKAISVHGEIREASGARSSSSIPTPVRRIGSLRRTWPGSDG